jgi:TatD DNase family protein
MPQFDADRDAAVERARAAGVETMLVVGGVDEHGGHRRALAVAERFGLPASAGVHPHEARLAAAATYDDLRALARERRIVAIGEIGLDFHYDHSPRPKQIEVLEWMLDCARRLSLPVILHNRESGGEMMALLERWGPAERPGVYHSFTEGAEYGKKAIALGYLVSFSGMLTFRAAENIRAAAAGLPLDAMMVETDTPFLAPVPHRGKPCEPAFVVETAKKLAEVKKTDLDAVAAATTANFERLFLGRAS